MRFSTIALLAVFFVQNVAFANPETSPNPSTDPGRGRLMELFIWKTSEELKLPTETETKFGEKVRSLNEKRKANGERLERAIKKLDDALKVPAAAGKTNKAVEAALTEYRNTLKELHQIQNDEISQMRAILGPEKLAKYLVVKNEISEKLKSFLSRPEGAPAPAKDAKPLAAPKVIEEK